MPVAALQNGSNGLAGIAFIAGAGFMAEIIAKACSSPQTVHINVGKREETLMLYVNIGTIEGAAFVLIAAFLEPKTRNALILGGLLEGVVTYGEYLYARSAGLSDVANGDQGTEDY
jgi:hypothetical protein